MHNKYIPNLFYRSIFDIDYNDLKKQGINTLFFDLDNTVISYDETEIIGNAKKLLEDLKKDFKILILSNSFKKRVKKATNNICWYVSFAKKPWRFGYKKALKMSKSLASESVMIGDQIMTDVKGAKKLGIKTILVYPIKKKSDKIWTRFNRKRELKLLRKIGKTDVATYNILKEYLL